MSSVDIAIIGSGIVGSSIAYHLSKSMDEKNISVYDRVTPGAETTSKSMAHLGFPSVPSQLPQKKYAFELYNKFLSNPRTNTRYELIGRFKIATTKKQDRKLKKQTGKIVDDEYSDIILNKKRPLGEYIPGDNFAQLAFLPILNKENVEGAIYEPKTGYVTPRKLALEFVERAKERGVIFENDRRVTDIDTENGQVVGINTHREKIDAKYVISAAGPWNPKVMNMAGLNIPIKHTLAPIMKFRHEYARSQVTPSIRHAGSDVYIRGGRDGVIHVGHNPDKSLSFSEATRYDPDNFGETVPKDLRERCKETMGELLSINEEAELVDEWVGIRSKTPDGNPIIGETKVKNLSIAAFNSSGIQLAPAAGRIIANQINNKSIPEWDNFWSVSRFKDF